MAEDDPTRHIFGPARDTLSVQAQQALQSAGCVGHLQEAPQRNRLMYQYHWIQQTYQYQNSQTIEVYQNAPNISKSTINT